MILYQWAARHNISPLAMSDLLQTLGIDTDPTPTATHAPLASEAAVQQQRMLQAAREGGRLWRNNSGACTDETGRLIRYGLGNTSAKLNKVMKSSDLIGITRVVVTPRMVGHVVGIFTAEEIKAPNWKYRESDDRARAQLAFINLVISLGGIGRFVTSA